MYKSNASHTKTLDGCKSVGFAVNRDVGENWFGFNFIIS